MVQLLTLKGPTEEAVRRITETLVGADLQVATSFDLRLAVAAHPLCPCPHHGTATCDCQMVVLLVYGPDACPATLVVHGRDGCTYLSLVSIPGQRPSPRLAVTIFDTLSLEAFSDHDQTKTYLQVS